jgi:hypothetical protein
MKWKNSSENFRDAEVVVLFKRISDGCVIARPGPAVPAVLFKSWFLSHSLLKFLEQAESAERAVRCGKGRPGESLHSMFRGTAG